MSSHELDPATLPTLVTPCGRRICSAETAVVEYQDNCLARPSVCVKFLIHQRGVE